MKKLLSEDIEERLFAIFLASISSKKSEILATMNLKKNDKISSLERDYLSWLKAETKSRNLLGKSRRNFI